MWYFYFTAMWCSRVNEWAIAVKLQGKQRLCTIAKLFNSPEVVSFHSERLLCFLEPNKTANRESRDKLGHDSQPELSKVVQSPTNA